VLSPDAFQRTRGGAQLQPAHTASTVRVADEQRLVTDGPHATTKKVFAGFYVIEVDDLDAASRSQHGFRRRDSAVPLRSVALWIADAGRT
jgi:hypothetical protein